MNNIKVRLPRESDAGRVEELLLYIAKLHRDGRSDLFIDAGAKFGRDEILALFADDDSPVFVAENGEGYVIGYIICRMKSSAGIIFPSRAVGCFMRMAFCSVPVVPGCRFGCQMLSMST